MSRAIILGKDTPDRLFRNRREAGQVLAGLLQAYRDRPDVVVLGLARGGVPVAWEVAAALRAPLDAFVVRKLGVPGHEEFAAGALASGGRVVLNDDVVRGLGLTPQQLRDIAEREGRELIRREAVYRDGRPPTDVTGKTVILVDDGLATGASMFAAVQALRELEPAQIVIAVPAAPESTCREFAGLVDDMVCASMPTPFLAVGASFWDFSQVSDDEVRTLLATPTTGPTVAPAAETAADIIRRVAIDAPAGVPPREMLSELIGDARIVLIGESSHGTHEFYQARAEITKWLIEEKGFCAVAAEADWPDAYRVNRYVRGLGEDTTAEEALRGFERFPSWMWRNNVVRDFVDWLRADNRRCESQHRRRAGFYGLDLYSLHRSMHEVVTYLDKIDPAAAGSTMHPPMTARPTGSGRLSAPDCRVKKRPSISWSTSSAMLLSTPAATACSPRTNCSTPNRTRRWYATLSTTTVRCSADASHPGTCGTSTWPTPCRRCSPTWTVIPARHPRESWCGRTIPMSATPGRRKCLRTAS